MVIHKFEAMPVNRLTNHLPYTEMIMVLEIALSRKV